MAVLILLRAAIALAPDGSRSVPRGAAARRQGAGVLLGVEVMVAAICAATSFLALGATLRTVLSVVVAGLVLLVGGIARNVLALARRPPDPGDGEPGGWRAGGVIYADRADPSLWVPKRLGVGWTLNFGHPAARWVLALLLLAPLALAAGIALLAARR